MTTLVVDTGQSIVGIFSVEDDEYVPYQYVDVFTALDRIADADDLPLRGIHVDMRSICWSDRILGGSLYFTYFAHFGTPPDFPDTYVGSNERDCHMTFKLWERWKQDDLWIFDGNTEGSKIYVEAPSEANKSFMISYTTHLPGEGRRKYDRLRDGTWRLRPR